MYTIIDVYHFSSSFLSRYPSIQRREGYWHELDVTQTEGVSAPKPGTPVNIELPDHSLLTLICLDAEDNRGGIGICLDREVPRLSKIIWGEGSE